MSTKCSVNIQANVRIVAAVDFKPLTSIEAQDIVVQVPVGITTYPNELESVCRTLLTDKFTNTFEERMKLSRTLKNSVGNAGVWTVDVMSIKCEVMQEQN